ncbi:hypothetical protein Dimus_020110 [Dionaea muscipula]
MEHLVKKKSVNLPKLMLGHMLHAVNRPVHDLPYGMSPFLKKNELELFEGVWWLGKGETRRRDAILHPEVPEDPTVLKVPGEVPTENSPILDEDNPRTDFITAVEPPRTDSLPAQADEVVVLKKELALARADIEELYRNQV